MGGYGSGIKYNRQKTLKVDDLLAFNINTYIKTKPAGYRTTLFEWYQNEERCASITIKEISGSEIEFSYWTPMPSAKLVTSRISLVKQSCHFGGFRYWINCPKCGRRCCSIYLFNHYFQCRKCIGALYACQSESHHDRLYRKARKLRHKLGANNNLTQPIIVKPKGMSWRKYTVLKANAAIAADKATLSSVCKVLGVSSVL